MIELLTGLPGSGKSYYAVSNKIVNALKSGRRVYAVMDLSINEEWAVITGLEYSVIKENLVVCEDLSFIPKLVENDYVVIDECQRFFRAGSNGDKEILFWFETHRHKGLDIVLITQDYMKILRQVYILAEVVYCFRKLSFIGLYNRSKCKVKAGVRDEDLIRSFQFKFEKRYCVLYRSYDNNRAVEGKNKSTNIFNSWIVRGALVGVAVIGYVIFYKPWVSTGKENQGVLSHDKNITPVAVGVIGSRGVVPVAGSGPDVVVNEDVIQGDTVYQITGSVGSPDGSDYTFLMCDGSTMSLRELRAAVGASVWLKDDLHGWRLQSKGVRYVVGCGFDKSNS